MNNLRLNWNEERWRTRDRLLDYDITIVPPHPHSGGIACPYPLEDEDLSPRIPSPEADSSLPFIYPWEATNLYELERSIYLIAQRNGYTGSEDTLWNRFSNGTVVTGTLATFPVPGDELNLYFDKETEILYYFKAVPNHISVDAATRIGATIVGTSQIDTEVEWTYLYIPVRALVIENTILDCGDASEYIG